MSEKWSERHLREQKVETLKVRLFDEISLELEREFFALQSSTKREIKMNPMFVRDCIDKMHDLYVLEDFLKYDERFMCFVMADKTQDVIIYKVQEDTLDWMLQNEQLLTDILFHIRNDGRSAEEVLSDEFFERQVFTIIDRCIWDDQRERGIVKEEDSALDTRLDSAKKQSEIMAGKNNGKEEIEKE